jgi:hypothetical protein
MNETRFSAADLEPGSEEIAAARRALVDRVAAVLGALSAGTWVGGMVALGACAAPMVFRLTPAPYSGFAMGEAFARFDQIALGAAVVLLGAEVARTWAGRGRSRSFWARTRRLAAVAIAGCAVFMGLKITPHINDLHRGGARRGEGPLGEELDRTHKTAEAVGKVETVLGIALVALHVLTLGARRPDDEENESYTTPAPPGPSA